MKQYRFAFVIFLFIGIVLGEENRFNQRGRLDTAQIEHTAKTDAQSDFNILSKFGWCGCSFISLWGSVFISDYLLFMVGFGTFASITAVVLTPVNLPKYREKELLSISSEYQRKVYRDTYVKQIKIQRTKYLLIGEVPNLLFLFVFWLFVSSLTGEICFAEGTEITMADGSLKNIEEIGVGDSVLSYNFETRNTEPDEVMELHSTANSNMMKMEFSDGTVIHSTFDHPYYVKNKGWCSLKPEVTNELITNITDVGQLQGGDVCHLLKDGQLKEVEFVGSERIPAFQRTYTIKRLKKNNAFFAEGVLVAVETVKERESKTLLGYLK